MLLYINNTSYPILLSSKTPNPIPKPRLIPITTTKMALKAVHVSDVPTLDLVPDNVATPFSLFSSGIEMKKQSRVPKFLVVGHRGHGMNNFQSLDPRMRAIKENTLLSFNSAARLPLDFVEFDVQVTKDGCPIIFHDNFILSEDNGTIFEKRVTELSLAEFLAYGPQKESGSSGKSLLRKTKDGQILNWVVEKDEAFCTLQEAFQQVGNPKSLGFNIELKFDDHVVYSHDHLSQALKSIMAIVLEFAGDRPVIFSSFQPDAALLAKKMQSVYPVYFLTDAGAQTFYDVRRNSLEDAIKVCLEGGLDGIVSEVRGVFRNPAAVGKIKDSKLSLLTYGKLNNVAEAVYMQHLMGIDGVIVDLVEEITEAVGEMIKPPSKDEGGELLMEDVKERPQFSQKEISFLLKLIPELIQQH
ncbi:Glycerophosphodiester phosphodiesterase GDPD1, chloroplastic [Linum grandiflorum]